LPRSSGGAFLQNQLGAHAAARDVADDVMSWEEGDEMIVAISQATAAAQIK
jgi:hypothetical protein